MQLDNNNLIAVTLTGPQKKGGHYVYSIVGNDRHGEFNNVRRYSDFDHLRTVLSSKWPCCYMPSLPQKKLIGNQDSIFIQIRKQGLQYFIATLKHLEHLWYTEEVQLFLRKVGDPQKQLQKIKQTNLTQILERYKQIFPQYLNVQVTKDLKDEIIDFSQYLKKAKGLVQNLQKMVEQVFNSRKKYNQKYLNFIQTLIPDYEKNCMQVYMNENNFQELIFTGSKRQRLLPYYDEFRKKTNSALIVMQQIRREKQQIHGFEDILKVKQYYTTQKQKAISKVKDLQIETTKIHAGKQSIISKIKSKSKDQQLKDNQNSIQKAQQQQKNLALLCQIIIVLLGKSQMKRFKHFRQKSYYSLLRKMFQIQKQQSLLKKNFWSTILKQNHQKQELDNFFQRQRTPVKDSQKQLQSNHIETSDIKSSQPQFIVTSQEPQQIKFIHQQKKQSEENYQKNESQSIQNQKNQNIQTIDIEVKQKVQQIHENQVIQETKSQEVGQIQVEQIKQDENEENYEIEE